MAVVARALVAAALGLAVGTANPDAARALNVGGPGVNPADFRITTFATGLSFPYGMAGPVRRITAGRDQSTYRSGRPSSTRSAS